MIVIDADMPKSCDDCEFNHFTYFGELVCSMRCAIEIDKEKRPDECPIVSELHNHGRLIDADYLKDVILVHNFHGNNKNIVPYSDRKGYRLRDREVLESIINAPTVIESDNNEKRKE